VNSTNKQPSLTVYELFMLGLCIYVLAALAVEAMARLDPEVVAILEYVDAAVCLVFLADFFGKLAVAESKLAYLKWGWIDMASSIPAVGPLRWGRLARVIRILRLLRAVRSTKLLAQYLLKRRAESAFATAAMTAGVGLFGTFTGLVATWFLAPGEEDQEDELELIRRRLTQIERHLQEIAQRQDPPDKPPLP